jgi:DEAD/DEAH box helicase domain-containing protein
VNPVEFLKHLQSSPAYKGQIVHVAHLPPRPARHAQPSEPVNAHVQRRLEEIGRWPLYSHQSRAIDAVRRGENVIISTPAASGKSLCYHVPVLEMALRERRSRALYIYPTKALTQDQLKGFQELSQGFKVNAAIFDGDTPSNERSALRRGVHVLLTNPDMLHFGVLPNHQSWSGFFRGLRYVVVDEAHVYRGVFGSHVANVLRRLRRICRRYGASPQFILCSATIGNAGELAERLTGLPHAVIDEDGSPSGGKRFAFWNPPVIDLKKGTRRSTNTEASGLFTELVKHHTRTITFVKTRRVAELVYKYTRDQLALEDRDLAKQVSPYRAGYMPEERRAIEKALFTGELLGVAATNALELGIDVGQLDATVITGYPGTIASTWQQAGRSGRRGKESLSVLVAQDNPLDQYLMRHPESFFGKPIEKALVAPQNPHIMASHILCAAYEWPLDASDEAIFCDTLWDRTREMEGHALLRRVGQRWFAAPSVGYPAEELNLRSASRHNYLVVEEASGTVIETVEEEAAFHQLYPGAVYLHMGEPFLITRLDQKARVAHASRREVPYYTQAKDITDIRITRQWESKTAGGVNVYLGEVEVSNHVVGYRKKAPLTEQDLGDEPLDLPTSNFNTVALWFDIPEMLVRWCSQDKLDLPGGLHAAEHAAIGLLPLFAMCDRNDIGGVSTAMHPDTGRPQVFIYDGHPGGVGISERGYHDMKELWLATLQAVSECICEGGCPSCIQSPKCGNNNKPLDKAVAVELLEMLCG